MGSKRFFRWKIGVRALAPLVLAALALAGWLGTAGSTARAQSQPVGAGAPVALADTPVFTIGVAAAISVPEIGVPSANAVQLAAAQINAAGGLQIGGIVYSVTVVVADSACDLEQGIVAANTLLDAGAVAVVGHSCSGATIAAEPIYAAAGVAVVSPSSTRPDVTEQGYTNTFRVVTRDDSPVAMLADHLYERLHRRRAAAVIVGGSWAAIIGGVFSDTFTSLGGAITSQQVISSTADFTATLTAILAESPDAIYIGADDPAAAGLFSKIAHDLGMPHATIAWPAFSEDRGLLAAYADAAGAAAGGDIAAMSFRAPADMPGYPDFNADYVAAGFPSYGDEATTFSAFAYDTAGIIFQAAQRAGSPDPGLIRDEIAATQGYAGVVGKYEGFDEKGDVIPQWMWLERFQGGTWTEVPPNEVFLPLTLKNAAP